MWSRAWGAEAAFMAITGSIPLTPMKAISIVIFSSTTSL
jgi:hypothetical protein